MLLEKNGLLARQPKSRRNGTRFQRLEEIVWCTVILALLRPMSFGASNRHGRNLPNSSGRHLFLYCTASVLKGVWRQMPGRVYPEGRDPC